MIYFGMRTPEERIGVSGLLEKVVCLRVLVMVKSQSMLSHGLFLNKTRYI